MLKYITIFVIMFTGCSTQMKQATGNKLKFDQTTTPGYSIRKIKNNLVMADLAGGKKSINLPSEISLNEKWHIGSCTKSMTAYLIAMLIDDKKLNIETKINSILDIPVKSEVSRLTIKIFSNAVVAVGF